jgi:hypothetical protein
LVHLRAARFHLRRYAASTFAANAASVDEPVDDPADNLRLLVK